MCVCVCVFQCDSSEIALSKRAPGAREAPDSTLTRICTSTQGGGGVRSHKQPSHRMRFPYAQKFWRWEGGRRHGDSRRGWGEGNWRWREVNTGIKLCGVFVRWYEQKSQACLRLPLGFGAQMKRGRVGGGNECVCCLKDPIWKDGFYTLLRPCCTWRSNQTQDLTVRAPRSSDQQTDLLDQTISTTHWTQISYFRPPLGLFEPDSTVSFPGKLLALPLGPN